MTQYRSEYYMTSDYEIIPTPATTGDLIIAVFWATPDGDWSDMSFYSYSPDAPSDHGQQYPCLDIWELRREIDWDRVDQAIAAAA